MTSLLVALLLLAFAAEGFAAPPPNAAAACTWSARDGRLTARYHGSTILTLRAASGGSPAAYASAVRQEDGKVEQILRFTPASGIGDVLVEGTVSGSEEAFAAENLGAAQARFPLVRNAVGPSHNQRNNAVYDRRWDWQVSGPDDATRIEPLSTGKGPSSFSIRATGPAVEIRFRPRYYQKHRNLTTFEPWTYRVRQESVTGWCSWWAYFDKFTEKDLQAVLDAWKAQHLADFGYRYIQIDDAYQDKAQGGTPGTWLQWNDKFPSGMDGYVKAVKRAGFEPGVWMSVQSYNETVAKEHPDWFVRGTDGTPLTAQWVTHAVDATVPAAARALVTPTFAGFRKAGFAYVKIDTLRHLLYDGLNNAPGYATSRGRTNTEIFRAYLAAARKALGPTPFVLACWGVLPEAIGLADGCRIGGDGFGPATLQQYNSWNGVVWRNDPDHCDLAPNPVLRPVLASMAGSMLMLSDKAEAYADSAFLEGARRSSPVLPTVPGQLYDVDPSKSDLFLTLPRSAILTGNGPSPVDATQQGNVCPWWLLEVSRPFESWNVLARMNWGTDDLPATQVRFDDLGLDPSVRYVVYEYWSRKYLGVCSGSFDDEAVPPGKMRLWSIRRAVDHPQVVSTSRHISQGGADLDDVRWDARANRLSIACRVVQGDRYETVVRVPDGYSFTSATADRYKPETALEGDVLRVTVDPTATGPVRLTIDFRR